MEQERNHGKKCFILKRMRYYLKSQEKLEAHLLDYMQKHPELTPEPPAPPPEEFQKIMGELNKRGSRMVVRQQLKILYYGHRFVNYLQKPMIISMVLFVIISGATIGASAKKAYDYQLRGRTKAEKITDAYKEIKENLGIRPLMIDNVPFDMKFYGMDIEGGNATIKLSYNDQNVYFIQAKYPILSSAGVISDKTRINSVYNKKINKDFEIEKNNFSDGAIEYSTSIVVDGAYYHLSGIIPEQDFIAIVKKLYF